MAAHADLTALVDLVVQHARAVVIRDRNAIDRGLDPRAAAYDQQGVPAVVFIRMLPLPLPGALGRLDFGGRQHRKDPMPHASRLIVNQPRAIGSWRVDIDLRAVEEERLRVVAAADLHAGIPTRLAKAADLQ